MTKEEIRKLALTYGFKTCPQANGSEDLDANVYRFARVVAYRARNPVSGIDELVTRLFGAEGLDDLPAVTTPQRKFFLYGYTTALVDFATGGRASRPVKEEAFRLPPKILDLPTSPSCKGWWGGACWSGASYGDADRRLSRCWSRGLSAWRWTGCWTRWTKEVSHDRRDVAQAARALRHHTASACRGDVHP